VALVKRFEDLAGWQEARRLTAHAYRITRATPLGRDRELASQLRRAAISTVTNIAEGFGSGTKTEFKRFLRYAIRSAVELQGCLYIAADQGYIGEVEFTEIYGSAERMKSLCSALLRRLSDKPKPTGNDRDRVADAPGVWLAKHGQPARRHVNTSIREYVRRTSARQHVSTSARAAAE